MTQTSAPRSTRIGIDVGGTNTDAVLMCGKQVLATVKRSTSADIASGMQEAVNALREASGDSLGDVEAVMVGTTQFINAFLQRKHLNEVAVMRVSLPKGDGVPPMVAWPDDLVSVIGEHIYMVHGGAYYTGREYIALDPQEIASAAQDIHSANIQSVAIVSNFAPIRPDIEESAAQIVREHCPEASITLSAEIGGLGLIDRENASIINASLTGFAQDVINGMTRALTDSGIDAPLFVSQNDGTLLDTSAAAKYPVFTCSAGPTNSIRGAAFLSGVSDAVIVDIGGTTTDIGFLKQGFPRETAIANMIGGVKTNFRMPDVLSVAIGGGSRVRESGQGISVGPDSVAHELTRKALVFGGDTLTCTDIAVAAGQMSLGDPAALSGLDPQLTEAALDEIHAKIDEAIDQMKTSAEQTPVVLVGGGAPLVGRGLSCASRLITPPHAGVANAVGAAIAQASGRIDRIYDFSEKGRDATLAQAREEAISKAIENGADPETVAVTDVIELPMTHMQTDAVQVKIRAVGDLQFAGASTNV